MIGYVTDVEGKELPEEGPHSRILIAQKGELTGGLNPILDLLRSEEHLKGVLLAG